MNLNELIHDAQSSLSYGTVSVTIKKHQGQVKTVDINKFTSQEVDSNTQALTIIGSMLKLLAESHEDGNLTFTVTLKRGTATRLNVQDFNRANF